MWFIAHLSLSSCNHLLVTRFIVYRKPGMGTRPGFPTPRPRSCAARPRHLNFWPRRDRGEALLRLETASRPRRQDRGHIPAVNPPFNYPQTKLRALKMAASGYRRSKFTTDSERQSSRPRFYNRCPESIVPPIWDRLFAFAEKVHLLYSFLIIIKNLTWWE